MEYLDVLLEKLANADGVGYHGNIQTVIKRELEEISISCNIEKDGSVVGIHPGTDKIGIMIACHSDEIGFIVNRIDDFGRIFFSEIGGFDVRILPGQEVVVHGREKLRGYIGAKPPHLLTADENKKISQIYELFIDTGLNAKSVRDKCQIGDCITFYSPYRRLHGDFRASKALDNRVGVACGITIMKELVNVNHKSTVYFVATSQEEFTGLGARIHSFRLPVHYNIVIDVTFGDHPELKEHEGFTLGSGPVIGKGPTVPEKLARLLAGTAKTLDIPYHFELSTRNTGTDADYIAFNRSGIPTGIVMIPLRNMHTPVEIVCLKDIERAVRLIAGFIRCLEGNS